MKIDRILTIYAANDGLKGLLLKRLFIMIMKNDLFKSNPKIQIKSQIRTIKGVYNEYVISLDARCMNILPALLSRIE